MSIRYLLLSLSIVFALAVNSQNALDFKMVDLNGRTWHLFDELNKGKTVLLDFFYADCVPCQTLTPQIAQIYSDYGLDTGQVLVLGISDRDDNAKVKKFEIDYGVNYPSCGTEGNGDSITLAYRSWFSFIGWPTYAVICPNHNIMWDVDKSQNGQPAIREAIDDCILYTSISTKKGSLSIDVVFGANEFQISGSTDDQITVEIYSSNGELVGSRNFRGNKDTLISTLNYQPGLYVINLFINKEHRTIKFIKSP